jgi:hypothetical protein
MKKFKIQRGFIGGIAAVAILAILTGVVLRFSLISASTVGNDANSRHCQGLVNGTIGKSGTEINNSTLTADETQQFGATAAAYEVKINGKRAPFRVVIGATELQKSGSGGKVKFNIALTYWGFCERYWVWGGFFGHWGSRCYNTWTNRVEFRFTDGTTTPLIYGTISKDQVWRGEIIKNISDYSQIALHLELAGENEDGCIPNALALKFPAPTPTPTPSSTATATATLTPTPTSTSSPTPTPVSESYDISLKHGFNAIVIPDSVKPVLTQKLKDAGMTVFAFNVTGGKTWNRTIKEFHPWQGYYVLNEGNDRTIKVDFVSPNYQYYKSIAPGWNLLANSSNENFKLSDLKYNIYGTISHNQSLIYKNTTSCADAGSKMAGSHCIEMTNVNPISLSDLIKNGRGYGKIYVIKDPHATTVDDAFKIIQVNDSNIDSVTIPKESPFWFYLWQ